jgi:trypsin-like peptidase
MWAGKTIALSAILVAIAAMTPAAASAWAPASQAKITPGVQTDTAGGQCTANFIYANGSDVYIGQAAHCAGTGEATETDGCAAASLPLGTPVTVSGATRPGTLAYSSWLTMQQVDEASPDTCAYNDLALVKLDPADVALVNPSVPRFGGPTGLGGPSATGDVVYSYGNSSLRFGITQLSPKQGIVVETVGDGWSRTVYTASPGIPGDSGSGFLDADGAAIGTLSTLAILPTPLSNGVADLGRELQYARTQGGLANLQLVNGTEPFRPNLLQAVLGG